MAQHLQQMVNRQVRGVLERDAASACPVVQSLSLFFWQHLARWSRQIALSPAPFTIALSGPSGSGKSFIRQALVDGLSAITEVSAFTQDNYYRDFSADFPHLPLSRFYDEINFDDPAHIRFRRLADDLLKLRSLTPGDVLPMPKLRFGTPDCKPSIIEHGHALAVRPFIVTEGIHAFHDPAVLACYDLKIYVDIDEAIRRERWLARNRRENRGVTDNMWRTTVDCLHRHILPTRPLADVVVNNAASREAVNAFIEEIITAVTRPLQRREIASVFQPGEPSGGISISLEDLSLASWRTISCQQFSHTRVLSLISPDSGTTVFRLQNKQPLSNQAMTNPSETFY